EDGIRDFHVTGVQTCALPIYASRAAKKRSRRLSRRTYAIRKRLITRRRRRGSAHASRALSARAFAACSPIPSAPIVSRSYWLIRSEERRVGKEWSSCCLWANE